VCVAAKTGGQSSGTGLTQKTARIVKINFSRRLNRDVPGDERLSSRFDRDEQT
jgi:hypothetical protein